MVIDIEKMHPLVYKKLLKNIEKNNVAHAYLFYGDKKALKLETALHFSKMILCQKKKNNIPCDSCYICNSINKNEFSELKIVDSGKSQIKKEEIMDLQANFTKKSLESNKRIYIINNCDKLNKYSANGLLKFLEEPEDDIIAILITDNLYNVIDTIVSRCQKIIFNTPKLDDIIDFSNVDNNKKGLTKLDYMLYNNADRVNEKNNLENTVNIVIEFIKRYELEEKNMFFEIHNFILKSIDIKEKNMVLDILLYFYNDVLDFYYKHEINYFDSHKDIIVKILEKNNINNIIHKIEVLLDLKEKMKYNLNNTLIFDKLYLQFEGGE
ncbi:MAG: DNA polymerase III subunit [Bacilli bacterium]